MASTSSSSPMPSTLGRGLRRRPPEAAAVHLCPVDWPTSGSEHVKKGRHRRFEEARALKRNNERSEEHTSELQSRQYLVCRLLLEKKKNIPCHILTMILDILADT